MAKYGATGRAGTRGALLGRVSAVLLLALGLGAGCSECFGSVYRSGDRTLERRHERDRAFEEAEEPEDGRR